MIGSLSKDMNDLRFPIGEFAKPEHLNAKERIAMIKTIAEFPEVIADLTDSLTEALDWRYRPKGWMIRQVVHHCADSHMNALIRFKLTLTEDSPTIRPYLEHLWAELPDTLESELDHSYSIIQGVHSRWNTLLLHMSESDFQRTYHHPELDEGFTLDQSLANYDWHCRHHAKHIEQALESKGRFN